MNILFIISSFPPGFPHTGPTTSVYETAKSLIERGHDVTVFTTDTKSATTRYTNYTNPEIMDGIRVFRFRNISTRLAASSFPCAPRMALSLVDFNKDIDIVHTHEHRTLHTWLAHRYSIKNGVPHVFEPRGSLPRKSKSYQKKLYDTLIGNSILENIDMIIASSQSEASQFSDVVPNYNVNKVAKVPNAINFDDYMDLPKKGVFRSKYQIGRDENIILFLSRLHERKGPELLLDAFSELDDTKTNKLVFVGPDEGMRSRLERQISELNISKDQILFTGPLFGHMKRAAYTDADLFVLPSLDEYESFGLVILEALACGTPVVATNVCGATEWVPDNFATVCEPSKIALVNALEEAITQEYPDESVMRTWIKTNCSWSSVAADLEDLYNQIR